MMYTYAIKVWLSHLWNLKNSTWKAGLKKLTFLTSHWDWQWRLAILTEIRHAHATEGLHNHSWNLESGIWKVVFGKLHWNTGIWKVVFRNISTCLPQQQLRFYICFCSYACFIGRRILPLWMLIEISIFQACLGISDDDWIL